MIERDTKLVTEAKNYNGTDLGLKTRQATDPQNLTRSALDWVVRTVGVVGIVGDGALVHVGRVQSLRWAGSNPE